jgi:hypothetical protein
MTLREARDIADTTEPLPLERLTKAAEFFAAKRGKSREDTLRLVALTRCIMRMRGDGA